MKSLAKKLDDALMLVEMAMLHKWVDSDISAGEKYSGFRFSPVNLKSLKTEKVWEVVSQKIARATGFDFIFIASDKFKTGSDKHSSAELSAVTGIPVEDFKRAITIILGYDQEQDVLTPWMILHQVGEIIDDGSLWPTIYRKYADMLDAAPSPQNVKDQKTLQRRNPHTHKAENAFTSLFKMRSARHFIHGPVDNFDTGPELVAEYLWHGQVRMNYPDWLDRTVVDSIKNDVERTIENHLNQMVGRSFNNLKGNF